MPCFDFHILTEVRTVEEHWLRGDLCTVYVAAPYGTRQEEGRRGGGEEGRRGGGEEGRREEGGGDGQRQ